MNTFNEIRFSGSVDEVNKKWHEQRNKGVGGSDMAAIMGLSNYKTPLDVWLEKTGRDAGEDISGKPQIIVGNALESVVRKWFAEQHPELVVREPKSMYRNVDNPFMQASLDGVCHIKGRRLSDVESFAVLECKTCGEYRSSDWDNGVPDYYLTQVTHYLAVTGWPRAYVAVLFGNREFCEYTIERDQDDVNVVVKAAEEFWGFVQRDEMPQLMAADVDRLYPEDDGELELPEDTAGFDQLANDYLGYSEVESMAKKAKNEISDKLKVMVAEHKGLQTGSYKVTYGTVHHKAKPAQPAKPAYETRQIRVTEIKEK
jgi:putative phage-type endonuclease